MSTDKERENIFSDFAMEADLTPNVLKVYIQRYPDLALELTDLFHELTMVDLENTVGSTLRQEELMEGEEVGERVAMVHAALSGENLRNLAHQLELPRDFIAGFRDVRVRFGSVPSSVVLNLARTIKVKTHHLIAYLQVQPGATSVLALKADAKPQGTSVQEYDEFIKSLDLSDSEVVALKRLED